MTSNDEIITEQPRSSITKTTAPPELELFGKSSPKIKKDNALEFLRNHDKLKVKQELNVTASICNCCDKLNKYSIKDKDGKTILTATEESICCNISCCRSNRKFEMRILDQNDDEVIHLSIPSECKCCRCCCCRFQKLDVFSPPDHKIGSIKESWNCFHKQLKVYSISNSDPIYSIDGPTCEMSSCCCSDVEFTVNNYETGEECGTISKKWSGLAKEVFTSADNFGIKFPDNADLNEKAILLGACIMIDLMYFEKNSDKDSDKDSND